LVEIHQLRELLEPQAAALAAERIPEETFQRLEELAARAGELQGAAWTEAVEQFDFTLHLAIADNTGNLALREAIRKCWSFKRLSYAAGPERPETLAKAYQEHLAILNALKGRDSQTAAAAMLFHLRSAAAMRHERGIV
jgi:GntR family transcriptional repressor for pyruvate dehydrogenase complex